MQLAANRIEQLALDYLERAVLLILYVPFAAKWGRASMSDPWALSMLALETVACALVIFRKHGNTGTAIGPMVLALLASGLPLLSLAKGDPWLWVAGPIMAAGTLWSLGAKLTLNRRFGIIPANRGIQSRGPYRIVRHPIYAGYLVTHLGVLLSWPTVWNFCVLVPAWAFQILRLVEEERFLSLDPAYRSYKQQVRWRLIPALF